MWNHPEISLTHGMPGADYFTREEKRVGMRKSSAVTVGRDRHTSGNIHTNVETKREFVNI